MSAPPLPPPRRKRRSGLPLVLGVVVMVGVLVWFARNMAASWDTLVHDLEQLSGAVLALAIFTNLLFQALVSLCYYHSLRLAGATVRPLPAMGVYLASQLGKYVPGKVVYVAGQIGLAKWLRIPIGQGALGFTAHHLMLVGTGLLIASPLLGMAVSRTVLFLSIGLAVAGAVVLAGGMWVGPFNAFQRRRGKSEFRTFTPARALAALGSATLGWAGYAAFTVLLAWGLLPDPTPMNAARVGLAAVGAWLLGFLSFIAPAGLGVREAALVLFTRGVLPEETAMAVALMMRLIHTAIQVPGGAIILPALMRGRDTGAAAEARR